jgi:hypothetical protein
MAPTPPVTVAAPHGAADMAALETVISSRRERSWSVWVDVDIRIPLPFKAPTHVIS